MLAGSNPLRRCTENLPLIGFVSRGLPELLSKTLVLILVVSILSPFLSLAVAWLEPLSAEASATWGHMVDIRLSEALQNTGILIMGSTLLAGVLGFITAYWVTFCRFPGRHLFCYLLPLPLAMPAYVAVLLYARPLEDEGLLLQLEAVSGLSLQFRSLGGAVLLYALVLYPYVFLLVRSRLSNIAANSLDCGRTLGLSRGALITRLLVPLTRPAWLAGMALVAMEVLADYGVASLMGVDTLTTVLYHSWVYQQAPEVAARLSGILVLFVAVVLGVEHMCRGRRRIANPSNAYRLVEASRLSTGSAFVASSTCLLLCVLGFLLPLVLLMSAAVPALDETVFGDLWAAWRDTTLLALMTALCASCAALALVAWSRRSQRQSWFQPLFTLLKLGYAIPGSVIAIAALLCVVAVERWLDGYWNTGLLLSGSMALLVLSYLIRFFSVSLQGTETAFAATTPDMRDVARTLGAGQWRIFSEVEWPVVRYALIASALVVAIDVIKELPATLLLRPYDVETLAVKTYLLASDDRLTLASPYALLLLLTSLALTLILNRWFHGKYAPYRTC